MAAGESFLRRSLEGLLDLGRHLLASAARLEGLETRKKGGDLIVTLYRKGCVEDLAERVERER
ncbi:MAG: hypothetical protein ACJ76Y_09460 [Thermoanaerobaculia bacterium]